MPNCVDCTKMDLQDKNKYNEAYCAELRKYTSLTGSCRYFEPRSSYSTCYLTTAMCEVLGKPDDCFELETLRGFREWYMYGVREYVDLLETYRRIGPMISTCLKTDTDSTLVATEMYENYIIPAVDFIFEEKYDEALQTYISMTNMLKERYGFEKFLSKKNNDKKKTLIKF